MDRAQIGGIDDIGLGALFGLYDHCFEVLGLLHH
jgi:2-iminoacetate synthase